MEIGLKIKELRLKNQLTQEELADRCELTKGYISQLENDLTSPSISTLKDILDALGTSLADFFGQDDDEKVVFGADDYSVKEEDGHAVTWLVSTAQKYEMEPILVTLSPSSAAIEDEAHEGEEFGFVMEGRIKLRLGKHEYTVKKGESFYYRADKAHRMEYAGGGKAVVLWVSCPPSF